MSWVTDYVSSNVVQYGTKPSQLDMTATSNDVVQYTSFNVTSGYIHHVPIQGLKPSTTYFYLIDPPANPDGAAGLRYFTTLPKVGKRVKNFQLAVAADIGQTNDSLLTIDHLLQDEESQMLILAGDTSYANCNPPEWDYWFNIMQVGSSRQGAFGWSAFNVAATPWLSLHHLLKPIVPQTAPSHTHIQPYAQQRPMMSLAGNHEIEWDSATADAFQGFRNRYRMPQVRPEEINCAFPPNSCTPSVYFSCYDYGNAYYSFDAATVHVVMLATYTYSNATSPQYAWIEQDLASVDRKVTPWVIVFMHAPFYNSNTAHQNEVRRPPSFQGMGARRGLCF